jgi:hypothetical protein
VGTAQESPFAGCEQQPRRLELRRFLRRSLSVAAV